MALETRAASRGPVVWLAGIALVLAASFGVRAVVQRIMTGPTTFRPEIAKEFFERYVDEDGRVVRRDQGSDTVSEGQAYAMLLAVAMDDPDAFGRVWRWTRDELERPDGLLSWHWSNGRITDPQPASDADVDAAYALLLAGERFGDPGYLRSARKIADAILDMETIRLDDARFLIAGPWASGSGVVNPSYLAPEAFRRFAGAFRDSRWNEVLAGANRMVDDLTSGGRVLPPDWARIDSDGRAVPTEGPAGAEGRTASGLDASRVLIRFASTCDDAVSDISARMWPLVSRWAPSDRHPAEVVAGAASAHAAGRSDRRDRMFEDAEEALRSAPTYYGWAWAALGRALLDERALMSCSDVLDSTAAFAPTIAWARTHEATTR